MAKKRGGAKGHYKSASHAAPQASAKIAQEMSSDEHPAVAAADRGSGEGKSDSVSFAGSNWPVAGGSSVGGGENNSAYLHGVSYDDSTAAPGESETEFSNGRANAQAMRIDDGHHGDGGADRNETVMMHQGNCVRMVDDSKDDGGEGLNASDVQLGGTSEGAERDVENELMNDAPPTTSSEQMRDLVPLVPELALPTHDEQMFNNQQYQQYDQQYHHHHHHPYLHPQFLEQLHHQQQQHEPIHQYYHQQLLPPFLMPRGPHIATNRTISNNNFGYETAPLGSPHGLNAHQVETAMHLANCAADPPMAATHAVARGTGRILMRENLPIQLVASRIVSETVLEEQELGPRRLVPLVRVDPGEFSPNGLPPPLSERQRIAEAGHPAFQAYLTSRATPPTVMPSIEAPNASRQHSARPVTTKMASSWCC